MTSMILKGLGVSAILYFAYRLLLRFGFKARRADLKRFDYVQHSLPGTDPTDLFVVVNGLLGSVESGTHVCKALCASAARKGRSIVALRVQASEAFFGMNVYAKGIVAASEVVQAEVATVLARHPSIKRVSMFGNSMGALVLRHAARALYRSKRCELGVFVAFPSPHFGLTDAQFARMSWLRQWATQLLPLAVFPHLRLRDRLGDNGNPIVADLAVDVAYLKAFRRRVCVASPHDRTVPFEEASLFAWPASAPLTVPVWVPDVASVVLAQQQSVVQEAPAPALRDMARSLQSMPWTIVAVTGRHDDSTKCWTSDAVVQAVIDEHCLN